MNKINEKMTTINRKTITIQNNDIKHSSSPVLKMQTLQ